MSDFFDTNLFAQLFKINSGARREFYRWVDAEIVKRKVRLASWSVNEYASRFVVQQVGGYLEDLKKLKTIQKEMEHMRRFLKMYVDDELLRGSSYADKAEYFRELDAVTEGIGRIRSVSKEVTANYSKLNTEFIERFEPVILQSDIYRLIEELHLPADARYMGRVPPGFQDETKLTNKYGDLIIWREILEYSKAQNIRKVVLVTNDGKKDLVYPPLQVEVSGRKEYNSDFTVIDPRLVFEFWHYTGSEEVHIIKFADLVKILWLQENSLFADLSAAVQINEQQKKKGRKDTPAPSVPARPPAAPPEEPAAQSEAPTPVGPDPEVVPQTAEVEGPSAAGHAHPQAHAVYSENALADIRYQSSDASTGNLISRLKSYNWYSQNDAVDDFLRLLPAATPTTEFAQDYLFVLGRNLYQAACGGAFKAISFLEQLATHLTHVEAFLREHLVNGMFYELYFNSEGAYRGVNLKTGFMEFLFALQTQPAYQQNIAFIRAALAAVEHRLVVQPNTAPELATIEVIYDPHGEERISAYIRSVHLVDREFLVAFPGSMPDTFFYGDKTAGELKREISRALAIPDGQLELLFVPQMDPEASYVFSYPFSHQIRRVPFEELVLPPPDFPV
ncbi:PIN-like domain-containing protein [Flaviaesturariibacter amylovorans]|uniref:PIN like domain-containing protein n=1 Tax=Flaviaesturariibacter amylovorans TaxID=1084520 RepID=A0ABP8H6S4_9BACT